MYLPPLKRKDTCYTSIPSSFLPASVFACFVFFFLQDGPFSLPCPNLPSHHLPANWSLPTLIFFLFDTQGKMKTANKNPEDKGNGKEKKKDMANRKDATLTHERREDDAVARYRCRQQPTTTTDRGGKKERKWRKWPTDWSYIRSFSLPTQQTPGWRHFESSVN